MSQSWTINKIPRVELITPITYLDHAHEVEYRLCTYDSTSAEGGLKLQNTFILKSYQEALDKFEEEKKAGRASNALITQMRKVKALLYRDIDKL